MRRHLTPAELEAARRRADKYIPRTHPTVEPPRLDRLPDDIRNLARFLFATPAACECGGVERSQAIASLASVAGVSYEALRQEFEAAAAAPRDAKIYRIRILRRRYELARHSGWDKSQVHREALAAAARYGKNGPIDIQGEGFTDDEIAALAALGAPARRHSTARPAEGSEPRTSASVPVAAGNPPKSPKERSAKRPRRRTAKPGS